MKRCSILGSALLLALTGCGEDEPTNDEPADGGHDAGSDGATPVPVDGGFDASIFQTLPDATAIADARADAVVALGEQTGTDAARPRPAADSSVPSDGPGPQVNDRFSAIYETILAARCTSCHDASHRSGLHMSSVAEAYNTLVNIPAGEGQSGEGSACGASGLKRVLPADPNRSLLVQKLGPAGNVPCGAHMPLGGELDERSLARIRAWISDGATDS